MLMIIIIVAQEERKGSKMDKITQLQRTNVCSLQWVRESLCNVRHHARLVLGECPVRILARTSSIL